MSKNTSRIQSNLLQQNCFVRDVTNKNDLGPTPTDSFVSLDEIVTDKGVELRETVNPYPITPQYVNSFVDTADYHRDPVSAINAGVKRPNLGDITDIQKVSSLGTDEARALYNQLKSRFEAVDKSSVTDTVTDSVSGGSDNVE